MTTALIERSQATINAVFTREQTELIKRTIAKGATDDELQLFMAQCQRTGLDPFDRQIYFIKRKQWSSRLNAYEEVGQTQTSIDGFRVVAERTGEMDGQDVAWCDEAGVWTDIWLKHSPPFAARVLAYRKGCAKPFPGIARYDEYVQTNREGKPNTMWAKMAANQLAKCAEALALRKAFPKQLSGLYTRDEMGQAENVSGYVVDAPQAKELALPPAMSPETAAAPSVGDTAHSSSDLGVDLPAGSVCIQQVRPGRASAEGEIVTTSGESFLFYKKQLRPIAEQACQDGAPVVLETKQAASGSSYVIGITRATLKPVEPVGEPLSVDSIPFAWIPFVVIPALSLLAVLA